MSDGLSFGLEAMRDLAEEVQQQERKYIDGVEQIQSLITRMGEIWTSKETGTYEAFKALFDEKYPDLIDGDHLMLEFKENINKYADNFENAANESKNSYE